MKLLYWSILVYEYEEASVTDAELKADRYDQSLEVCAASTSKHGASCEEHQHWKRFVKHAPHCNDCSGSESILQGSKADVEVRLGSALDLFGLKALQVFREAGQDTKVLVGWGADTIVVAFRGTASFANVLNDIQVRIAHSESW